MTTPNPSLGGGFAQIAKGVLLVILAGAVAWVMVSSCVSEIKRHYFTQGHGWTDSDASWLITASVVAYCPEYVLPSNRW